MGNELPEIQITDDSLNLQEDKHEESIIRTKTIFIKLKPSFADDNDDIKFKGKDFPTSVKSLTITKDVTNKLMKKLLSSKFGLNDPDFILKLRNTNGSIIPFGYSLKENTISTPYCLEICDRYQNVKPLQRTVSLPTYEQVLKRKMNNVTNRLTKLEHFAPDLPNKQRIKVKEEIKDLNEKMNILERKLEDADATQWQGMFKRNPLW